MRIAVDTRLFHTDTPTPLIEFTEELLVRLAALHPDNQFIFLFDSTATFASKLPANVTPVTIHPRPASFILLKWWYDIKLPFALKKHKADLFIGTYGLCSLNTRVPQVLIVANHLLSNKVAFPFKGVYSFHKMYIKRFVKRARKVVTLSVFVRDELADLYRLNKLSITTVEGCVSDVFKPVGWEQRERIKEKYADGCEYFLFSLNRATSPNLLPVLKAFSLFKKWQKSNMKLVIVRSTVGMIQKELEQLSSYKYRASVAIVENLAEAEMAELMAGSYCMIYPAIYDGFPVAVLEAIACEVPIITNGKSSMSEMAGEAALYAHPNEHEKLAEQMKRIFKDEQLRNGLVSAAKARSMQYNWDKSTAAFWSVIEQVVSQ
jgi:glycosyltransferase involved in cell wall biosynthesis